MPGLCCEATQRNLHFKTLQEVATGAPGKSIIVHHKPLQVSHTGISSPGYGRRHSHIPSNRILISFVGCRVASGEGSASFVIPHPRPLPHSSQLERNTGKRICRDTQPPPAGGTGLLVCWLCRCLRRLLLGWAGGPGSQDEGRGGALPLELQRPRKGRARGMTPKMPSPRLWVLLKKPGMVTLI